MIESQHIELPLYEFFKKLQAYDAQLNHQALGYDVYLRLLEVLTKGYGLFSIDDLYAICRIICLKPYHQERVFKTLFEEHIKLKIATSETKKRETSGLKAEEETKQSKDKVKKDTSQDETEDDLPLEEDEMSEEEELELADQKEKTISLNFKSATVAQNEFLSTDMSTIEQHIFAKIFRLRGKYSTISPRRIEQGLRSLRIEQEINKGKQSDLSATIERISKQGYLDKLQYQPLTGTTTTINLLIDQGGSMIAFYDLIYLLKEKVDMVNNQANSVYYFRNCPITKLFSNSEQTKGVYIQDFLAKNKKPLMIISDAGAARGRYNSERIKATEQFLKQCKQIPLIWINPVPKSRWEQTSAAYIAELVPMYEATDTAFIHALKHLK